MEGIAILALLKAKSLVDQALQTRFVEKIVGQFLVRKHGERGALGAGDEFRGFLDCQVGVLADDRHHHADHDLEPMNLTCFLFPLTRPGIHAL